MPKAFLGAGVFCVDQVRVIDGWPESGSTAMVTQSLPDANGGGPWNVLTVRGTSFWDDLI
jgi:hypothetical protein